MPQGLVEQFELAAQAEKQGHEKVLPAGLGGFDEIVEKSRHQESCMRGSH